MRWKAVLMRVAGALLVIAGLGAGYFWFYHIGPYRRLYDPEWLRQHSDVACWDESQECIHRFGWYHDAMVGRYGDKQWLFRFWVRTPHKPEAQQ